MLFAAIILPLNYIPYRGVPGADSDSSIIYFTVYDPTDVLSKCCVRTCSLSLPTLPTNPPTHAHTVGDFTVDLYTQRQPYTDDTRQEFDSNLGRHTDFLIVGLYIFAAKVYDRFFIYL